MDIKRYLQDVRDERTLDLRGFLISVDGMHYAGKSTQIMCLDAACETFGYQSHAFRETSLATDALYKQRKRIRDEATMTQNIVESRQYAWRTFLFPYLSTQQALAIIDRSSYDTLAQQMLRRRLSSSGIEELVQQMFPAPIIPAHLALFLVCSDEVLEQRKRERSGGYRVGDRATRTKDGVPHKADETASREREVFLQIAQMVPDSVVIDTSDCGRVTSNEDGSWSWLYTTIKHRLPSLQRERAG